MPIEIESITFVHFQTRESASQHRDQLLVLLDGNHPPRTLQQWAGEPAQPRADLQHGVGRSCFERIRDSRQQPGIREEMLSQPALGPRHC